MLPLGQSRECDLNYRTRCWIVQIRNDASMHTVHCILYIAYYVQCTLSIAQLSYGVRCDQMKTFSHFISSFLIDILERVRVSGDHKECKLIILDYHSGCSWIAFVDYTHTNLPVCVLKNSSQIFLFSSSFQHDNFFFFFFYNVIRSQ